MNQEVHYFRIGLFVFVSALLLAAGLVVFGAGKIFERKMVFETYLSSSVAGIDAGAPVRFRGVAIGKVTDVTFVFNEYPEEDRSGIYNFVVVVMRVSKPVFPGMFEMEDVSETIERAVAQGLRARIEPQGITGMNYVELDFLDPKQFPPLEIDWMPRNYYIPSAPGQVASILDSINSMMRDIEHFNLGELGDQILAMTKNVNKAVVDAQLGKVSEDIQAFSVNATKMVSNLDRIMEEADIPELTASTKASIDAVKGAVDDLKRILVNLEPATRLNSDDINATLTNMRIISDNLRSLSGELRADPSRIIFGSPPARPSVLDEEPESSDPASRRRFFGPRR